MNQSNELLNHIVVRIASENMYKEIHSVSDSPDKDELLNMSVQELINLYPAKINACDNKLKLDLVKTSLEKEVDANQKYTAFLESKIAKPIGFDPIKHLEDLRLVKPKSLANQKVVDKEVVQ